MTPSQLAWSHFRTSSLLGLLCLPVGAALVGAGQAWVGQPGYPDPSSMPLGVRLVGSLAMAWVWALGSVYWGFLFLGIPAVLVGVLRQPLMRLLFNACRASAPDTALATALVGTFLVFELPVGLVGNLLGNWMGSSQAYGYSLEVFCFGLSLPWLVGSLWATWLLRGQLTAL